MSDQPTILEYLERIESRQSEISTLKSLLERYELRLFLINTGNANKNEFQLNEDKILEIKTGAEIRKLERNISHLEHEFIAVYKFVVSKINELKQQLQSQI